MSKNDLTVSFELDQSLNVDASPILDKIDSLFEKAYSDKDGETLLNACKELLMKMQLSGIALAKLLWLLSQFWTDFEYEDDFYSSVADSLGLHRFTIDRYVGVWNMYAKHLIPEGLEPEILCRNIKEQIPIAKAISQGYDIDTPTWEKIVNATDLSEISKIIRDDVKHAPPRKNTLQIALDLMGTIWATKEGKRMFVGSLEINDDDPIVKSAIERILRGAGIYRG